MLKVMENYVTFNFLHNKFLYFFSDFSRLVLGILFIFPALVFLLLIIYKKLRKKFPLVVNCWFCNNNSSVPYEKSNAWECPHCKQYNGFNKDGDYNKVIPEQYNYTLNEAKFKTVRTSLEHAGTNIQSNGFCKSCNINQQLKIQQLASFVPINENNYYNEIEEYREKLEKAYQLCSKCEKNLQETLQKQEYKLLQNRLNSQNYIAPSQRSKIWTQIGRDNNTFILIKKIGILGLKVIQTISAIFLFLAILIHFETETHYLSSTLPDLMVWEPLSSVTQVLLYCEDKIYSIKRELSFVGVICCILITLESQIKQNFLNLLAWGFFHLSLWKTFTGVQLVMSGICLFLNIQGTQNKFLHFNKKSLPKKSGFQPVKQVFAESYNTLGEPSRMFSPVTNHNISANVNADIDSFESRKIKETKQKLTITPESEEKKWEKQDENELESLPNEEKEKVEYKSTNLSGKCKVSPPAEAERNCGESNGPVNEVYDILNGLQLGGKQKKSKKPPNFLFANHNFSDTRSSPSIIKPAKFIKNLNSTSWTDSNECNSRSSTPSSGYFSQKPEKVEPVRYDYPKAISPISVNSFGRPGPGHCYDYYEGNHGFFNSINCFSPGYLPFQHFPGPLGHTAVYTCTRPTGFPFPFSPYQGFPSQKFSPTSPRFSDSSDCDNLFQESSKRFSRNSKWLKFKTILYYFSVFLNFTTMMSLIYFTSTGIISVDWNLPKLNFFF